MNANVPMGVNWIGLYTLIAKEVRRFVKVYWQTIVAPVITTIFQGGGVSRGVSSAEIRHS